MYQLLCVSSFPSTTGSSHTIDPQVQSLYCISSSSARMERRKDLLGYKGRWLTKWLPKEGHKYLSPSSRKCLLDQYDHPFYYPRWDTKLHNPGMLSLYTIKQTINAEETKAGAQCPTDIALNISIQHIPQQKILDCLLNPTDYLEAHASSQLQWLAVQM
jgi:hypothetical protein